MRAMSNTVQISIDVIVEVKLGHVTLAMRAEGIKVPVGTEEEASGKIALDILQKNGFNIGWRPSRLKEEDKGE